ncbi:hypothetical protein P9112_004093 [Eukaryota sp. TZLM1-RC]
MFLIFWTKWRFFGNEKEISKTHSKVEFFRMSSQPLKFVEALSEQSLFSSAVIKFNYFPFLAITFQVKKKVSDINAPPRKGVYIHGLSLEGARWMFKLVVSLNQNLRYFWMKFQCFI